jgi:copper resistance protein B
VTWNRTYGNTADYAREEGESRSEARLYSVCGCGFESH